jgi:transcriptional regulator with XRE-family HTH domain
MRRSLIFTANDCRATLGGMSGEIAGFAPLRTMLAGMPEKPAQPAEGALIQRAMVRQRLSARQAAVKAGISEGRWRQIVSGYQSARGQQFPVTAPAATLAHMAAAVGLTPEDLTEAGRGDAADILRDLNQHGPSQPGPAAARASTSERDEALLKVLASDLPEDKKEQIIRLLIAEKHAADRARAQRAEDLIRIAKPTD